MGLGLTEAYYSAIGIKGYIACALLIVPHYLIAAIALLYGSMESIRMSLLLSRQLLPRAAWAVCGRISRCTA